MSAKDLVETCIFIPYEGPGGDEDEDACEPEIPTVPDFGERDLSSGPRLRMEAFDRVWEGVHGRIREVLRDMHKPIIADVVEAVRNAYKDPSPLMLHTELPTIAISGIDSSSTVSICAAVHLTLLSTPITGPDETGLEGSAMSEDEDEGHERLPTRVDRPIALVSTLSASDCSNLMSAMKSLISGFTEHYAIGSEDPSQSRRRGPVSATLVSYDINVLVAWFDAFRAEHPVDQLPQLVVFINEFEEIDPAVIQDLLYICSLHIPNLPIVFILSLSSPPVPSFLHATYPQATLSMLQIKRVTAIGGQDVLREVLLKTFFDSGFEPVVHLGPSTIDYVVEHFTRNSGSIDAVLGIMKLIFLRHFMEPLTVITIDECLGKDTIEEAANLLSEESKKAFVLSLLARLHHPQKSMLKTPKKKMTWESQTPMGLLGAVAEVRRENATIARRRRVAFNVLLLVREFMLSHEYKSAGDGRTVLEMMSACLKGSLAMKEGKYLCTMVKKLPDGQLRELLDLLYGFFFNQSRQVREEEGDEVTTLLAKWMAGLDSSSGEESRMNEEMNSPVALSTNHVEVAKDCGEWLLNYFDERMENYTEPNLWDIWYTESPMVISEMVNPSPRSIVVGALLHPEHFSGTEDASRSKHVPDIGLLFQRYLESGRLINVHDWYESFAAALDAERANERREKRTQNGVLPVQTPRRGTFGSGRNSASPTKTMKSKRNGKGNEVATPSRRKGKQRAMPADSDDEEGMASGEEPGPDEAQGDEERKREIQVRFLRGVQELDFMGFVKHTKRKGEYVYKTVYDPPE